MALECDLAVELAQTRRAAHGDSAFARAPVPALRERRRRLRAPAPRARVPQPEVRAQDVLGEVVHVRGVARAPRPAARAGRAAHAAGPRALLRAGRRGCAVVGLVQVRDDPELDAAGGEEEVARAAPAAQLAADGCERRF
jgi:hypothetical protein